MNSAPGVLEKELMSKIQVEESVCQGIVKFLNACKNETQSLEAAKNLQLGQLRVDMLKFELNKFRRGRGSPARKIGILKHHSVIVDSSINTQYFPGNPSYAAVSLSDIRIPLLWRPKDHMHVSYNHRESQQV